MVTRWHIYFLGLALLLLWIGCEEETTERQTVDLPDTLYSDMTIAAYSDVELHDHLTVLEGVVMTVELGVHFLVDEGMIIRIEGSLIAQGSGDDPIVFKAAASADEWYGIRSTLEDDNVSAMELNHVQVKDCVQGIEISGYNTQLQNVKVSNSVIGITCYGDSGTILDDLELRGCEIGLAIRNHSDVQIFHLWSHDNDVGIRAYNNRALLTQSVIENNHSGIVCELPDDSLRIIDNRIRNSENGLMYYSTSHVVLHNNTISNNTRGVLLVSYHRATTSVSHNNIINNSQYAMGYTDPVWPSDDAIDISNNWWGTTDSVAIADRIIDVYDNPAYDTLRFVPYALEQF
jgi:hypothetical protein